MEKERQTPCSQSCALVATEPFSTNQSCRLEGPRGRGVGVGVGVNPLMPFCLSCREIISMKEKSKYKFAPVVLPPEFNSFFQGNGI